MCKCFSKDTSCVASSSTYTNEYNNRDTFRCDACWGLSCGFVYESPVRDERFSIEDMRFRLDLRCALVSEPFEYQGHEHPLFLALKSKEEILARCQICQETDDDYSRKLNCIECDNYIICLSVLSYHTRLGISMTNIS